MEKIDQYMPYTDCKSIAQPRKRVNWKGKNYLRCIKRLLNQRKTEKKIASIIQDMDAVVIGGGNMLMELDHTLGYTYFCYLYTKVSKHLRIPIFMVSVGVGPIKTFVQKWCVKKAVKNCTYKSVRDTRSFNLCKSMGIDIAQCGDPAFSFVPPPPKKTASNNKNQRIGLCLINYTCVDTLIDPDSYLSFCRKLIEILRQQFPQNEIVLYSSEASDYDVINDVSQVFIRDKHVQVSHVTSQDELIKLYATLDNIVSFRMHAIIVGMLCNIPCIGISWQAKVSSLFEMCDCSENVFKIEPKIQAKEIVKTLEKIVADRTYTIEKQNAFIKRQVLTFQAEINRIVDYIN